MPKFVHPLIYAGLAIGLAGALAWFAQVASAPPATPSFQLAEANGQTHALGDYTGRVLVINFWASWCAPCRAEMPMLSRAARRYRHLGVRFIGITVDDPGRAQAYIARHPVSYPTVYGAQTAALQQAYQAARDPAGALPYTVIVNINQRIVWRYAGRLSEKTLDRALNRFGLPITPRIGQQAAGNTLKNPANGRG